MEVREDTVYWSGTSFAMDPAKAWTVNFSQKTNEIADKSEFHALRLVRGN
jgi:hypothetical protein